MKKLRYVFAVVILLVAVPSARPSNMDCSPQGYNYYQGGIPYCFYSSILRDCMVCTVEVQGQ
jgi:hypothetical protein